MRIWKIVFGSACLLTVLWLLAPPSSRDGGEPGVVEITFMGPSGPLAGAMEDAVREFEAESRAAHARDPSHPMYRVVSGQNASRNQTDDPTRFLLSVAGGSPPDVIYFDRGAICEWAARGAFTPLSAFLDRDRAEDHADAVVVGDYYASCLDEATYRGNIYGIPTGVDDRALFYNKDLLRRAGFVDENGEARPPRTWEELEEMAVRLTEHDERGRLTRVGFVPNFGNAWLCLYAWMNGGELMNAEGTRCTLNDPRNVEALEFMTRIYDRLGGAGKVNAFQSTFQGGDLDPFLAGQVAMKIDGFWALRGPLARHGGNFRFGVAPPPLPEREVALGRQPLSWSGGWCLAIPSTVQNKDAAWALVRFLSTRRAMHIINAGENLLAGSKGEVFVPPQRANRVFNEEQFQEYVTDNPAMNPQVAEAVRVFNDLLPDARFRPVSPVGQFLWVRKNMATEDAMFHKMTAQAALDSANQDVQKALDEALRPPRGEPLNWNFFFWLYGTLLIGTAGGAYWWDVRRVGRTSSGSFRTQWRGGVICALPWIVGFVVFTGGPLLFSIIISFCDFDILSPARFSGLANYRRMAAEDPLFWKSLGNTVFMVLGIPLGMGLSLGIALLLNLKVRGVAVWRTFFYLPAIVPAVASSILWIWIFNPTGGLLNGALASFGIQGPNWLQDENTSKPALILMGLWGAGGGMIIWLAGLKAISEHYYEAAALDGANGWQKFLHITLPLLSPYIFFNLVMGLIGTFQIFTQAFIMTQGGPVNSTLFYAYYLFNNAFRYLHMGYASAMAWVLFLIILGLTIVQMKWAKRWVHYEEG